MRCDSPATGLAAPQVEGQVGAFRQSCLRLIGVLVFADVIPAWASPSWLWTVSSPREILKPMNVVMPNTIWNDNVIASGGVPSTPVAVGAPGAKSYDQAKKRL